MNSRWIREFSGAVAGLILMLLFSVAAHALSAPEDIRAFDRPDDSGGSISISWSPMPYDGEATEYVVAVSESPEGPFIEAMRFPSDQELASEQKEPFWARRTPKDWHLVQVDQYSVAGEERTLENGKPYYFRVSAEDASGTFVGETVSAVPGENWFNWPKLNNLVFMVLFCGIVLGFIGRAKKKTLFLRRIPGLNAVDEAIGRATEMGKPIYYLTGRLGMSSVSTIAATTILGEIAKRVAQYDAQLRVPHTDPIVMAVCQEIVREAYIEAGRPDAYHEDINFFVTTDQFSYTAAVDGMMVREEPAACFFMGFYYAESLLLAEVGASVGAIQVAGTDAEHQLPFFVTACDYTLIGEELYAASAYLSREPVLVGTLRGQDVGKAALMAFILFGVCIVTLSTLLGAEQVVGYVLELFADF
ncbi:MAG: DUF6754 domain-containing protein [Candidatus Latescibacterota bacterium]